jgi:hypothetical protein
VKQFEIELLTTVNFELNVPTPLRFLDFFLWSLDLSDCEYTKEFCHFLLDMMLLEFIYQQFTPSVIAASALFCTGKFMKNLPHANGIRGPNMEALENMIRE